VDYRGGGGAPANRPSRAAGREEEKLDFSYSDHRTGGEKKRGTKSPRLARTLSTFCRASERRKKIKKERGKGAWLVALLDPEQHSHDLWGMERARRGGGIGGRDR